MTDENIIKVKNLLEQYVQSEIDLKQTIEQSKAIGAKIELLMKKMDEDRKTLFQYLTLFFIEKSDSSQFNIISEGSLKPIGNFSELLGLPEL